VRLAKELQNDSNALLRLHVYQATLGNEGLSLTGTRDPTMSTQQLIDIIVEVVVKAIASAGIRKTIELWSDGIKSMLNYAAHDIPRMEILPVEDAEKLTELAYMLKKFYTP